ncbi:SDR family NAD(P)-dependent oxidoreductase [Streptomyces sp. TE5632]
MSPRTASPSIRGLSAVVTGGSRGLGLLLADELAAQHCAVTMVARDGEELTRAADLLRRRRGARIRTAVCDVRDRAAVRDVLGETARECGGVDLVIANAGIIQVAPVEAVGAEEFRSAMDTIFYGALHTSLEALPYLRRSPAGGRLALIGSVGGLLAAPHLLPYSCAKSAVGTLAEGLYAEAARDGVTVTAVHPGLMRTGSHLHAVFGGEQEKEFAWFSTVAGMPLVSMDAGRAAKAVVRGIQRRRTRIVLTPAARAAGLVHGVAPALTTRATSLVARMLPSAGDGRRGFRRGAEVGPPSHPVARKVRAWGSALNDRASRAYNQRSV